MRAIDEARQKLWNGADPFAGSPQFPVDVQGWGGSQHPFLRAGVEQIKPRIIVEVGVWKGASVIFMAKRARELGLDCVVIAVDTFLGSVENWTNENERPGLMIEHGYPRLFFTFAANIVAEGLQDYVVPLPLDSVNARELITRRDIVPDMLHIDGGHDYRSVMNDLMQWWPMLRPGGLYVGDDYDSYWPEVVKATDDFFKANPPAHFEGKSPKCYAVKRTT